MKKNLYREKFPSVIFLKECFQYNPINGILSWKIRPVSHFVSEKRATAWNKRYANTECKVVKPVNNTLSYYKVSIHKKQYYVHTLIWLMMYNELPEGIVEHNDGNGLNNRLGNLRDKSFSENSLKAKISKNNTLGYIGISLQKNGKYRSQVCYNGKNIALGAYDDAKFASMCHHTAVYILTNEDHSIEGIFKKDTKEFDYIMDIVSRHKNNVKLYQRNKSGYIGVSYRKSRNKFYATVSKNGKNIQLGSSSDAFYCSRLYETAMNIMFDKMNDNAFLESDSEYQIVFNKINNR